MVETTLFISSLFSFLQTLENAADTILWPAFSPEFENKGGLYLESGKEVTPSWEATNSYTQQRLWGRSFELLRKHL